MLKLLMKVKDLGATMMHNDTMLEPRKIGIMIMENTLLFYGTRKRLRFIFLYNRQP